MYSIYPPEYLGFLFYSINITLIPNYDAVLEVHFMDEKDCISNIEHKHVLVYFSLNGVSPPGAANKQWCDIV